jgi:hypothetical protein
MIIVVVCSSRGADPPKGLMPDRIGPTGHTQGQTMTAVTMVAIEPTGPAIRAALAAHAPEDEAGFVAELRDALGSTEQDLDLAGPQAVLRRWHARALMAANPLSADELAQLARARSGDLTGFVEHHDDGTTTIF